MNLTPVSVGYQNLTLNMFLVKIKEAVWQANSINNDVAPVISLEFSFHRTYSSPVIS